jgi:hypothetical protein
MTEEAVGDKRGLIPFYGRQWDDAAREAGYFGARRDSPDRERIAREVSQNLFEIDPDPGPPAWAVRQAKQRAERQAREAEEARILQAKYDLYQKEYDQHKAGGPTPEERLHNQVMEFGLRRLTPRMEDGDGFVPMRRIPPPPACFPPLRYDFTSDISDSGDDSDPGVAGEAARLEERRRRERDIELRVDRRERRARRHGGWYSEVNDPRRDRDSDITDTDESDTDQDPVRESDGGY